MGEVALDGADRLLQDVVIDADAHQFVAAKPRLSDRCLDLIELLVVPNGEVNLVEAKVPCIRVARLFVDGGGGDGQVLVFRSMTAANLVILPG